MLKVLLRWDDFRDFNSQISELIEFSEAISRQLYGWIESLKNSEISGQRHLDEKTRARYSGKQEREAFIQALDRMNKQETERRNPIKQPWPQDFRPASCYEI